VERETKPLRSPIGQVLERLAELQANTAPISLTIGGVSAHGQVTHDEVIVRQAPPAVVTAVVKEFSYVHLDKDGLHIPVMRET
jgi:hypothetical protein